MPTWLPILLSVCGVLLGIGGYFNGMEAKRYARKRDTEGDWQKKIDVLKDEFTPLVNICQDLKGRLQVVELQLAVFWKGVSFSAAQTLHSPHTPELDALIEKFQQDRIDDQEIREFKKMLRAIASDESDKLKQKAARDVLTLIQVRYEIGSELSEVVNA